MNTVTMNWQLIIIPDVDEEWGKEGKRRKERETERKRKERQNKE